MFAYNDAKLAVVTNPKGAKYADIVKSAERCAAGCVHPGTPWDAGEKNLDKLDRPREKVQLRPSMKLFTFLRGEAFARGVHPPEHKGTAGMPITRVPFAPRLIVPLSQNVGRPAGRSSRSARRCCAANRSREADGFVSVPHHAPVSGVVEAIRLQPDLGRAVDGIGDHPRAARFAAERRMGGAAGSR